MTDLIFDNGVLLTQEPGLPVAEAMAVTGGKITAVGRSTDIRSMAGASTRRVDLYGRTLIPGLIDAHAHIWKIGHLLTTMVDLRRTRSVGEILALLPAAQGRLGASAWLLGRGYNEANLAEGRAPTRAELDRAVSDRPVVLTRTCGHIYATNSVALARAGITRDTPDPAGGVIGRDATGEPTGLLHETAMGLINRHLPPPTRDDYAAMIGAGLTHQLSLGITSTNDAGVSPELLAVYRWMDREGMLPSRVNVMALRKVDGVGVVPLPERFVSDRLRVDTVKFLADGGLSGATAALSVRYRHADTRGVLRFERDELLALAREAHVAGLRVATHAIGDVTIDQVLGVYAALGTGRLRHRIEHFGLPSAAQLALAARLNVIAAPQTIFLHELGKNFRQYLPDPLFARTYPVRAMLDAGITVALSSDAPVVENDNPLQGMRSAIDREDGAGAAILPEQAISATEALHAYTMGGAVASGDDDNRGSLAPGKWADVAILSGNPLAVAPRGLTGLRVEATYLAGALAYQA